MFIVCQKLYCLPCITFLSLHKTSRKINITFLLYFIEKEMDPQRADLSKPRQMVQVCKLYVLYHNAFRHVYPETQLDLRQD